MMTDGYGANFCSRKRCQIGYDFSVETMEHTVFSCNALRDIGDTVDIQYTGVKGPPNPPTKNSLLTHAWVRRAHHEAPM